MPDELVNVRYMVDDVDAAVGLHTTHVGFELRSSAAPALGGWNRMHFIVADIDGEVERMRAAGITFRNDIISGPGGRQILLEDPAGNPIELFQPRAA